MLRPSRATCWAGSTATVAAFALTVALVPVPAFAAPLSPIVIDGMNIDSHGEAVVNNVERHAIAPGLVHVEYDRLDDTGWQQVNVLKAQLSPDTVRVGYLTPPKVSGNGATVTEMVDSAGAIAGINLDRFDINNSWAAAGWGVRNGELIKSGNSDASASIVIDDNGIGSLADLLLVGSAKIGDTSVPIQGINVFQFSSGVAMYTEQWGAFNRGRALNGAAGVEVLVGADDTVISVSESTGAGQLEPGVRALVTRHDSAEAAVLRALAPGDSVEISYTIDSGEIEVREAGGAWHRLLKDGEVFDNGSGDHFTATHPRTMVGFSEDGATAYFVAVDGRSTTADGMYFTQMSDLMADLGAHDAISADGGGSTQMNVRLPGDARTSIANSPSDGIERRDGDGLGLMLAKQGSGTLTDVLVDAASGDEDALRVFSGLNRTLVATGVDETLTPIAESPAISWSAEGGVTTQIDATTARFQGGEQGVATTTATAGALSAATEILVLDELERLTASTSVLSLPNAEATAVLSLTGHDENGFEAPVEPVDVTVSGNDEGLLDIVDVGDGTFGIRPLLSSGGTTLTLSVGDVSVQVAVTVGIREEVIIDMDQVTTDNWRTTGARSTSSVKASAGFDGGTAAQITYDFSFESATRTANSRPAVGHPGYDIPGQPRTIKVWVKGTTTVGENADTYVGYSDATGTFKYLYGPAPVGTDWQQISYPVPEGTAYPIKLQMLSAYEASAGNRPIGEMWFDDPTAEVAHDVELPILGFQADDTILADGATDASPLRVAVMSDAQFVARDPESGAVQGAREALREVVASQPDALYINGDFVDEASPEDFALAKRILDEELAGVEFPWTYVPGNHEVMGGAIENFESAFGATFTSTDVEGTRFITLNTASGRLSDDYAQMPFLRDRLAEAAEDDSLTGVVVMQHHPIDDPLVAKASQLGDRRDAGLEQDWIEEFREESGKSIAFVGSHVGVFHSKTEDNIPYFINGNSGKNPTASEFGSFTGWTMLGIDPAQGDWRADGKDLADDNAGWFGAEVQTRVESISIPALGGPLDPGAEAALAPTILQDDTRHREVAWPMSYTWTGEGVHVGAVTDAPSDAVIAIDPETHGVTALRYGVATATLSLNGVSESVEVAVGDLDVAVSAHTRTLAGKQYVSVTATNNEAVAVDLVIETPFGSKTFAGVAPGKSASVALNSRATSIEAGDVSVTATAVIDGESVSVTKTASYAAAPAS